MQTMFNYLILFILASCSGTGNTGSSQNKIQPEKQSLVFHRQKEPNENAFTLDRKSVV